MTLRQRLYIDGLWLAHQACEAVDHSINWLDVPALARRVGCGDPPNACYFGICDPQDPASEAPIRALSQALEMAGVICHIRREPAESLECGRCGHGWEHQPISLLAADLALQVAEDAACDEIDRAVLVADPRTVDRLARLFARCHPGKSVQWLAPEAVDLTQFRLGRAVQLAPGATLLRPACWAPPQTARPGRPASLVERS